MIIKLNYTELPKNIFRVLHWRIQEQQVTETIVRTERKIGRNERVSIKNISTGENKMVKYKQAIPLIENGSWVLIDE